MTDLFNLMQSQPAPFLAFGAVVLIIVALGFERAGQEAREYVRANLRVVVCPTCHATSGHECRTSSGRKARWHAGRRSA